MATVTPAQETFSISQKPQQGLGTITTKTFVVPLSAEQYTAATGGFQFDVSAFFNSIESVKIDNPIVGLTPGGGGYNGQALLKFNAEANGIITIRGFDQNMTEIAPDDTYTSAAPHVQFTVVGKANP